MKIAFYFLVAILAIGNEASSEPHGEIVQLGKDWRMMLIGGAEAGCERTIKRRKTTGRKLELVERVEICGAEPAESEWFLVDKKRGRALRLGNLATFSPKDTYLTFGDSDHLSEGSYIEKTRNLEKLFHRQPKVIPNSNSESDGGTYWSHREIIGWDSDSVARVAESCCGTVAFYRFNVVTNKKSKCGGGNGIGVHEMKGEKRLDWICPALTVGAEIRTGVSSSAERRTRCQTSGQRTRKLNSDQFLRCNERLLSARWTLQNGPKQPKRAKTSIGKSAA